MDERIDRRDFLNNAMRAVAGISAIGLGSRTIDGFASGALPPRALNGRGYIMVVVGTKVPFLSHQPMFGDRGFDSPYRYQVIVEADFGADQSRYEDARARDVRNQKRALYTFDPGGFSLPRLSRSSPARTRVTGTISRNPLSEEPLEIVAEDVKCTVRKIYFQQFSARTKKPSQLQYLMFGKPPEIFMAHIITRPPDFDHIVALKNVDSSSIPGDFNRELSRGLRITLPEKNLVNLRPTKDRLVTAQAETPAVRTKPKITFEVESELYLEEGELRVPTEYATTEAERLAQFP